MAVGSSIDADEGAAGPAFNSGDRSRDRGDSQTGAIVIHALNGSQYSDGRSVVEDGAALSGQANGPGP